MKYYKRTDGGYTQVDETTNPSYEMYCSLNYKEITKEEYDKATFVPEPEPQKPTYEELVVAKIRTKYSVNEELAILRQRDTKPQEFAEYNEFCELCKKEAKNDLQ